MRRGNPGKSEVRRTAHNITVGDAAWNRLRAEANRRSLAENREVSVSDLVEELGLSLPAAVIV